MWAADGLSLKQWWDNWARTGPARLGRRAAGRGQWGAEETFEGENAMGVTPSAPIYEHDTLNGTGKPPGHQPFPSATIATSFPHHCPSMSSHQECTMGKSPPSRNVGSQRQTCHRAAPSVSGVSCVCSSPQRHITSAGSLGSPGASRAGSQKASWREVRRRERTQGRQ